MTEPVYKPILFKPELVVEILEGRKTQTRRVALPDGRASKYSGVDVLWVRETWAPRPGGHIYLATFAGNKKPDRWRPSIHMPRKACRLELRVLDIRRERLQDITEADAKAEGVKPSSTPFAQRGAGMTFQNLRAQFRELWDSINAARMYAWADDPEVDVITFEIYRVKEKGRWRDVEAAL